MLNRKYERLTIIHFPFSSNTIWVWAERVGKVWTMFPFIYIQCEEQREEREGAWHQGDPSHPCQLNTNLPSPLKHWLRSSLETHGKHPNDRGGQVIEPLTSSHHQCCCWCESKTLLCSAVSAKFVSTFLTLFSIKISSCLLLLGPWLLLTLSFLPAQCSAPPARLREDGGRWV